MKPKDERKMSNAGADTTPTMSDDLDIPMDGSIDPDQEAMEDEWYAERDRRITLCAEKIVACFKDVRRELGGYCHPDEAWELFERFVQVCRPKKEKKKKGPHDPDLNKKLLAAHDNAPAGKKMADTNAVGEEYGMEPDTTQRQVRRLLKARKERDDLAKQMAVQFSEFADRVVKERASLPKDE